MRRISGGLCLAALLVVSGATATTASAAWPNIVAGWGESEDYQLRGGGDSLVPLPMFEPTGVSAVAAGEEFVLVLADGTVKGWGANGVGELGDGTSNDRESTPVTVTGLPEAPTAIAAGEQFGVALEPNGTVWAWGDNENGQLGDETSAGPSKCSVTETPCSTEAVEVQGLPIEKEKVTAISAGGGHALALTEGGNVWAWGENEFGQLGYAPSEGPDKCAGLACSTKAVQVKGLPEDQVSSISAGYGDSYAVLKNGEVMAWGDNDTGELGDGTSEGPEKCEAIPCSEKPVYVLELKEVKAVSGGDGFALALMGSKEEAGKVKSWGDDEDGELGIGSEPKTRCAGEPGVACVLTPKEVSGLSEVGAVAAGIADGYALLANGTRVWAWGENDYAQLGIGNKKGEKCGTKYCHRSPIQVASLVRNVAGIAAGGWDGYAYGPPPPAITSVSPGTGEPAGGKEVTIEGLDFTPLVAVEFGPVPVPAEDILKVERDKIVVKDPSGQDLVNVVATSSEGMIEQSRETTASRFRYFNETEAPEFGRCATTLGGTGKYADSDCIFAETGGSYEWQAGVAKTHFTVSGGTASFEAISGKKEVLEMVCKAEGGSGEYSGTKAVTNTAIKFTGCEAAEGSSKCASAGAKEGEVVTNTLAGELGWKEVIPGEVGLDLRPKAGVFMEFTCGSTKYQVEGSVIGGIEANEMSTGNTVTYKSHDGAQSPKEFQGGSEDQLRFSYSGGSGKLGMKAAITLTSEEEVELNNTI